MAGMVRKKIKIKPASIALKTSSKSPFTKNNITTKYSGIAIVKLTKNRAILLFIYILF